MKKKRDIFKELVDGISEMRGVREKKLTLKNYKIEPLSLPKTSPKFIRETRELIGASQAIFAGLLQVNPRTLANWEQGRSEPNDQAMTLILLVRTFPDTIERLRQIAA